ncbi:MAG: NnrS family protein [Roseicyclus sp.]|nr:NnrS family protein [Roseicyclus sp.]MBO6626546.1 NnrS family protein [Roseicyclus sp.]MBO6923283.1 NnrS family protein [Roseicyclus sp.]
MSCGPNQGQHRPLPKSRAAILADEGFRLFFLLGAVHAALWPAFWVLALGFDLPLADRVSPSLWHAHEMLIGAFGAALIGFLTTAAPEWTDTPPPRGRPLWALAALWGTGRIVGLLGWDGMAAVGALADLAWMTALMVFLLRLSWRRRTDRLLSFAAWLALLMTCTAVAHWGFLVGDITLAGRALEWVGLVFLGLLGLALARITVPVTNLILDPTEATSPFRPHPGRLNLAPGLVLVALAGDVAGLGPMVTAFLMFGAGAAFMDRMGEAFIGRAAMRAEILMLAGASALAGAGLMLTAAARFGAPWDPVAGLHVALMGGLGLAVYAVFCIAGRLHTGRPLGLTWIERWGALAIVAAVALRAAPGFGWMPPGSIHGLSALLWAGGFLGWACISWSPFSRPGWASPTATHAKAIDPDSAFQAAAE